jgi:DNA-binding transcriptional regulator YbjK
MSRRDDVLEAAIHVLAVGGVRGLTHHAVDVHGDLPAGTTSNHFRSRRALTMGTMERIADLLAGIIGQIGSAPVTNVDELAETLGQNLAMSLGPGRELGLALAALFAEAAIDPSLHDLVVRTNRLWWSAIEKLLRDAGVTDHLEFRAKCILSFGNGVAIDQLAVRDPDFDPVAAMRLSVPGFCAPF